MHVLPRELWTLILSFICNEPKFIHVITTCKLFWKIGITLLSPSDSYNFAFIQACSKGLFHSVKFILEYYNDFDPNQGYCYDSSKNGFYMASAHGRIDIVKLIMKDKRSDISKAISRAFYVASLNDYVGVVKELMKSDKMNDSIIELYFPYLCRYMCVNAVREIMKLPQFEGNSDMFIELCRCGVKDVVMEMIKEDRIDPTHKNDLILSEIFHNCHTELAHELLKDPRINPAYNRNYLIKHVCKYRKPNLLKLLLQHPKVNPKVLNSCPVILRIGLGNEVIRELLEKDGRLNLPEKGKEWEMPKKKRRRG